MAFPSGCSDRDSRLAAIFITSSFLPMTSVTAGFPCVSVPVLSKTIVFILCAISNEAASRIKIPFSALRPIPTIIAIGVASPRAHGQAIINTATKFTRAKVNAGSGPKNSQIINVKIEIKITAGTK